MSLPITDVQMAWLADLTGQFQFHYRVSPAPVLRERKFLSYTILFDCAPGATHLQYTQFWDLVSVRYIHLLATCILGGSRQLFAYSQGLLFPTDVMFSLM